MKPFNIEEYLKNPNRELVTRDGREVRIICTDRKDADYPIVALISNKFDGGENAMYCTEEGKSDTDSTSSLDLFFATKKREGWINVFKGADCNTYVGDSYIFKSEEDAEKEGKAHKSYIGTTKIEWEE